MAMYGPVQTPAAVGNNGQAAATVTTPTRVIGTINGVFIQYNDAPPAATTDVGIKTKALTGILPSINILTLSNAATDGYFHPRKQAVDTAGAAIEGAYAPFTVDDYIQIDLAGANASDSVTVWFYLE
jgi:hypothetical protein